jgi:tetratricopeptide (TPR) repeat protein
LANTFVVDRRNNRLVWSTSDIIEVDPASGSVRDGAYVSQTAFTIAQGTGIIHSNERRSNYPVDTPYGCWLRFTTQMLSNHVVDDPILAECAEDWHEAVPDRPVPAGLYAWTLLDKSILKLGDGNRQALVQEALETLENARALNPTSGFLPAVATRAYALADEEAAMRAAADQALALNPGNLEIEGLAGSILAMRNDPRGERLVDDAIAHHPSPPPWYFVAKFVSAMMREDTAGAGRALARLQQLNHTLPVLPIFSAAYEARTGQLQKARASWERAETVQPILRVDPDLFLERTPLSPVVAARLKKWLGPVLD